MLKIISDPWMVIALYFIVLLAIGIYSSFKIKSAGDYFVAGRKGNLFQVTGSLFATVVGASALIGTFELGQKEGWPALWFLLCGSAGLLILLPLAKKVSAYGHYTLPEMLSLFYGRKAELAASVIIPVAWTGVIAAQIIAAAKILDGMHLVSYTTASFLCGGIFIIYTLIGGQVSVIKTDVFQAILIYLGLIVIFTGAILKGLNGAPKNFVPGKMFSDTFSPFDLFILFLTYSVTFMVGPDVYSRIFCARSGRTAAQSVFFTALLLVPVGYIMTWLGIQSRLFYQGSSAAGLMDMGSNILPPVASGIFAAALLSAVMSSASATLLTSSTILSGLTTGMADRKLLPRTRIFIVVTGIASIIIALWVNSVIQSLLFALTFFSGAFVLPVMAGLLGARVNKSNIMAAILTGGLIALAGKILQVTYDNFTGNLLIIVAYLGNGFFLFSHLKSRKIILRNKKID